MPVITFPANTKDTIDSIREAIGRDVDFYVEHRVLCSACDLDPITDTSVNAFCWLCHGIGYVISGETTSVLAHITWGNSDQLNWQTGGKLFDGDVRLQIEYTLANKNLVDICKRVTVDNRSVSIRDIIIRGVPQINRIILDCILEENSK